MYTDFISTLRRYCSKDMVKTRVFVYELDPYNPTDEVITFIQWMPIFKKLARCDIFLNKFDAFIAWERADIHIIANLAVIIERKYKELEPIVKYDYEHTKSELLKLQELTKNKRFLDNANPQVIQSKYERLQYLHKQIQIEQIVNYVNTFKIQFFELIWLCGSIEHVQWYIQFMREQICMASVDPEYHYYSNKWFAYIYDETITVEEFSRLLYDLTVGKDFHFDTYLDKNHRLWRKIDGKVYAAGIQSVTKSINVVKSSEKYRKTLHTYYRIRILWWYRINGKDELSIWRTQSMRGTRTNMLKQAYELHKMYIAKLDDFHYAGITIEAINYPAVKEQIPKQFIKCIRK